MRNHCSFCSSGVRKLNCYKNIGKMKYAFDDDQCQVTLPKYTVMRQRLMGLLESSSWLVRAAIGSNWCPHHLRDSTKDRGCLRHRCCGSSRIAPVLMPLHGLEAHHPANCEYVVSRAVLLPHQRRAFADLTLPYQMPGWLWGEIAPSHPAVCPVLADRTLLQCQRIVHTLINQHNTNNNWDMQGSELHTDFIIVKV